MALYRISDDCRNKHEKGDGVTNDETEKKWEKKEL